MAYKFVPYAPEGSGDSIVVDVESFPVENVDNEKIYRRSDLIPGTKMYLCFGPGETTRFDEQVPDASITYIVVDELPSTLVPSDLEAFNLTLYVVRGSGTAYLTMEQLEGVPADIGDLFGGLPPQGIVTDVSEMVQAGYYFILGEDRIVANFGVPDVNLDNRIYGYTTEDGWVNLSDKMQEAKDNEPFLNFIKNATVSSSNGIVTLNALSNTDTMTDVVIPQWIDSISKSIIESLAELKCSEDDNYVYCRNDRGDNAVLVQSKLGSDVSSIDIPKSVSIVGSYTFHNSYGNNTVKAINFVDDGAPRSIGVCAFTSFNSVEAIKLPHPIKVVESQAFGFFSNLKTVEISSPMLSYFSSRAFDSCPNIESITWVGPYTPNRIYVENNCIIDKDNMTLLIGCKNSIIPSNVLRIAEHAFSKRMIGNITIPANVQCIDSRAFEDSSASSTVTFLGTPMSIHSNAFASNSAIDIYVPWAEGEVEGAPWGANYATIHYNHTV